MIYLFSDGFQDQIGGKENKKFSIKSFRELLSEISNLSVEKQKKKIEEEFVLWKGNNEQRDDVLLFGFRVS